MPGVARGAAAVASRPARRIRGSSTRTPLPEPPAVPVAPDAPVLTGGPGDTQNVLSWTLPYHGGSPILSYELQRDSVEIFDQLSPRTFTDTGRTNGVAYDYRVRAVNLVGAGAWSNTVTLTPVAPLPTFPPDPPVISGTAGDTVCTVAWTTPADNGSAIVSYELQRDGVTIQNDLSTGRNDTALTNDRAYSYQVRAINGEGPGIYSNVITLTPVAPPPTLTKPDPPVLSGTAGNLQNSLTWTTPFDGNDPITSYELQRDTVTIYTALSPQSYTDTGRTNSVDYAYRVRAINGTGSSDWSNVLTLTPVAPPSAPDPPVLSGSGGNNSASLSWTQPFSGGSAITSYELYYGFSLKQNALTPRTFTETGLTNGVQRTYWVRAVNAVGASGPSNLVDITPTAPGGSPTLPSDATVGRAASGLNYWCNTIQYDMNAFTVWKAQSGFDSYRPGGFQLDGYKQTATIGHVNLNQQFLRTGSALVAPYNTAQSYGMQRLMEGGTDGTWPANTGPFVAKRAGITTRAFFGLKLHKIPTSGDQGPFGWTWSDNAGWADVASKIGDLAGAIRTAQGDGFQFDPEFGDWSDGPTSGQTLAQQMALVEQRGYEVGREIYQAFPSCTICYYGTFPKGAMHDEVVVRNQNSSWGVYNGHSVTNSSESWVSSNSQLMANIRHLQFYEGIWRAGSQFAAADAKWVFEDALFYRNSGYPSLPGDGYAYALRWNLWGIFSWMTRGGVNGTLARSTLNWILPRFHVTPCTWAGTDQGNFYWDSQPQEPQFSNMMKSARIYGMAGFKSEYAYGMIHPSAQTDSTPYQPAPPYSAAIYNQHSFGRPVGGFSYGLNLYTGASGAAVAHTGVLGGAPQGGGTAGTYNAATQSGSGGSTVSYGATAATTPSPNWTQRYVVPSSRSVEMRAACSTTPIPSAPPTFTVAPVAHVSGGQVTVTCRVTHAHSPWHVDVHRGSSFNPANPSLSFDGVMTMVFEPNNGTNLPPAGLASPYMQCSYTSTSGGWALGDWVVVGAYSTKEDTAWQKVQVT